MKRDTLFIMGLIVIIYSLIFRYAEYWETKELNEVWGYRLYFRGVLTGTLILCLWGAITFKNYIQNAIISLGSGVLVLLIISTINLLYDSVDPNNNIIEVKNYYYFTLGAAGVAFILITLIRLLWKGLYHYIKLLRSWLR